MAHPIIALIGVPYDGAATLGWPGARYAPAEVRRHLTWMLNRVQGGQIYWVDEDRIVPFDLGQLHDAGDAAVVPHDLVATLAAARAKTAEETRNGRVPAVVGGDDSILFPAVAGFHDAVAGTVAIVHFDAHLDLMDESPAQGRYSHSSGMRRALELPRVDQRRCVQVGTRSFNFPSSKRFIDTRSDLLSCQRARCAAAERSGHSPGSEKSPAARITSSSASTWTSSILHTRLASGGTSPTV